MRLSTGDPARVAYPVFRRPVCPSCGETMFAAAATEFLGRGKITNIWKCDSCEHEFRTALALPDEN
jgi:ribosomal protein L37AE/L43A